MNGEFVTTSYNCVPAKGNSTLRYFAVLSDDHPRINRIDVQITSSHNFNVLLTPFYTEKNLDKYVNLLSEVEQIIMKKYVLCD
jgi:hypothetical protein